MDISLPTLTATQHLFMLNTFSIALIITLTAFVFLILARAEEEQKHRGVITISSLDIGAVAYHHFRISESRSEAYKFFGGAHEPPDKSFDNAYQ